MVEKFTPLLKYRIPSWFIFIPVFQYRIDAAVEFIIFLYYARHHLLDQQLKMWWNHVSVAVLVLKHQAHQLTKKWRAST